MSDEHDPDDDDVPVDDIRIDPWGRRLCDAARRRSRLPCNGPAVTGQTKCRMHLGKSIDQLKAETHTLIADAALEALGLNMTLLRDDGTPHHVRAQIARDLLDRAGFDAKLRLEVTRHSELDREIERLVAELAAAGETTAADEIAGDS